MKNTMYSQSDLMPWVEALHEDVPGLRVFDAHVHIGLQDPAGLEALAEEVVRALGEVDARAVVFPLKEPDGYQAANRRLIQLANMRPQQLRALVRVDPADDPTGQVRDGLDLGAVGVKLHPRGEGFRVADDRLNDVFGIADERRLPVMIHAGVGDPAIGPEALDRARQHPGARVILAHCAIGSFEQVIHGIADVPNLFFDTSWWNPADIWAVFRMVPPSRILYGSDIPFTSPACAMIMTGRLAIEAGLSAEQVRAVMGGQLDRLVSHEDPLDVGSAPAEVGDLAPELERLYVTLLTSVEPMLRGEDPGQGLELAQAAAENPVGPHSEVIECIAALLQLNERKTEPDPLRS
ncbi:MAG TPA: amidohydrolase family protein, partial [Propionibacteriaceae bacterium]|nr:amidohydrolase family protein [Propionibacteriaceae bacterium]